MFDSLIRLKMFLFGNVLLILISLLFIVDAVKFREAEENIMERIKEYFGNVPKVKQDYIVSDSLSKLVSNFYDGEVSVFPLFRVSVIINQTAVKIPWTNGKAHLLEGKKYKKKYTYIKKKKNARK